MRRVNWLALALVFFLPAVAYADSEYEPYSYVRNSPNGNYLFVMLALDYTESDPNRELKSIFPASGLYLNDVSRTPLWTVDWYARNVVVFSDGVHVARFSSWAESTSAEGFTFFANGKLLRSYRISDLIDTAFASDKTIFDFFWIKDTAVDENNRTFQLLTSSDEKYTFDYTTGEIVLARRPLRAFFVLVAATVLFLGLRRFGRGRSAAQN